MDTQTLFNAAMSVVSILGGIMLKSIYDAIQDLRNKDSELHERINELPNIYIRRDDFMHFCDEIRATLIRIEGKLDGKADK